MICGIDPGLSGAVAIVAENHVTIFDMPTHEITVGRSRKRVIDEYELGRWFDLHGGGIKLAIIEDPHAMPQQGVTSSFNFGFNCGIARGVLAANFIPMRPVRPAIWKRAMGLTVDKDASRREASRRLPRFSHLWPLKKHNGRAEAVLLALYGAALP